MKTIPSKFVKHHARETDSTEYPILYTFARNLCQFITNITRHKFVEIFRSIFFGRIF